jgi:hypothetical protein
MSKPQDAQQSVLMVVEPGAAGPGQAKVNCTGLRPQGWVLRWVR